MVATHNQHTPKHDLDTALSTITSFDAPAIQTVFSNRSIVHHPKAGLNPLADATSYLFSIIGKLKHLTTYRQLGKLQKELIEEINIAQETIKKYGYHAEYSAVCHYILLATLDDIISNTAWGCHGQWDGYSLLKTFNQDTQHQTKFFTIMERVVKEPAHYIDLMELMYLCLSLGYKGQYRGTEHNQFQLEQITHNLYKHIRAYRGNVSKLLSPASVSQQKPNITKPASNTSFLFIFFVSACIVMTIFVSLGYLMDVISNESYKTISTVKQ